MTLDEARRAVPRPLRHLIPTDPAEAAVSACRDLLGAPAAVVMWLDGSGQLCVFAPPAGVVFKPLARRQFPLTAGYLTGRKR